MKHDIRPLKADRFLKNALEYIQPFKGTYIYDAKVRDYREKTDQINAGYGEWLKKMLNFIIENYNLDKNSRILDIGCGTGELTVRIKSLGYDVYGIDIHREHLELAKILAVENGLNEGMFILNNLNKLSFEDYSFDIITMFSVLEHLDNYALTWLLPELRRVCRKLVYILVPNRLKAIDDHTGLKLVPWMPRQLAVNYVK